MEEDATTEYRPSTAAGVPWTVWLLLAGAIAQLGLRIAPDAYSVFGPYFLVDAVTVVNWTQSVTIFLLAAAVVLSVDRWPSGRRPLLLGAAVLASVALLRLGSDIWWAVWEASGHAYEGSQPWLLGGSIAEGILYLLAHLLLAAGLWTARAHRPLGRTRAAFMALIGLVGLVAAGVGLWAATRIMAFGPGDSVAYAAAMMTLASAGFASLAVLALAAARVAPERGGLAEVLIAVGAFIAVLASAWNRGVIYVIPFQDVPQTAQVWYFTVPLATEVLGLFMMIAGFGVATAAVRRLHTPGRAAA